MLWIIARSGHRLIWYPRISHDEGYRRPLLEPPMLIRLPAVVTFIAGLHALVPSLARNEPYLDATSCGHAGRPSGSSTVDSCAGASRTILGSAAYRHHTRNGNRRQ